MLFPERTYPLTELLYPGAQKYWEWIQVRLCFQREHLWQRLTLARAIYNPATSLLLLDEPTSMQDAQSRATIDELIRSRSPERAIVLVTHRETTDGVEPTLQVDLGAAMDQVSET